MIYSSKIKSDTIFLNGEKLDIVFENNSDWKKYLYQTLELDYPKFHKMDSLSKMSILAVTFLKKKVDFTQFGDDGLVSIFANSSSSGVTDKKFISSYDENGNPSPSLFVYTLPNILIGELAIHNKWYGENIFFINKNFSPELYLEQIDLYFSKGAKACLCGWVEDGVDKQECVVFLVVNEGRKITKKELLNIYNQ
jgi:hypothetical protein